MLAAKIRRGAKRKADALTMLAFEVEEEPDPEQRARRVIQHAGRWDWAPYQSVEAFQRLVELFDGAAKLAAFVPYVGRFIHCGKSAILGSGADVDISPVVVFVIRHLVHSPHHHAFLFYFVIRHRERLRNTEHVCEWYRNQAADMADSGVLNSSGGCTPNLVWDPPGVFFAPGDQRPQRDKSVALITYIVQRAWPSIARFDQVIVDSRVAEAGVDAQRELVWALLTGFANSMDEREMKQFPPILSGLDHVVDVYALSEHLNLRRADVCRPEILPKIPAMMLASPWFPESFVALGEMHPEQVVYSDMGFVVDLATVFEECTRYGRFLRQPHWLSVYSYPLTPARYQFVKSMEERANECRGQLRDALLQNTRLDGDVTGLIVSYW